MPAKDPTIRLMRRFSRDELPVSSFGEQRLSSFTNFSILPTTATTDLVTVGIGTEAPTMSPKGGVRLVTQATDPADGDNCFVRGVTNTNWGLASTAANNFLSTSTTGLCMMKTQVSIPTLAADGAFYTIGLHENVPTTALDPAGDAGDCVDFLFASVAAEVANTVSSITKWTCHQAKAGTDTYIDSGVTVVAGTEYRMTISIGSDGKPRYYINGVQVATGVAMTASKPLAVVGGVEIGALGGTADLQGNFDIRFIKISRTMA